MSKLRRLGERFDKLIDRQLEVTLKNGGSTFNSIGIDFTERCQGYAVSIFPEHGVVVEGKIDRKDLEFYWKSILPLRAFSAQKLAVGTWYSGREDKTYLDISMIVDNKERAILLGLMNNQKAIWDFGKKEEIFLNRD